MASAGLTCIIFVGLDAFSMQGASDSVATSAWYCVCPWNRMETGWSEHVIHALRRLEVHGFEITFLVEHIPLFDRLRQLPLVCSVPFPR